MSDHITNLPWCICFIHQRVPLVYLLYFTYNCNKLGYLVAKLEIRDTKLEAAGYNTAFKLLPLKLSARHWSSCYFVLSWKVLTTFRIEQRIISTQCACAHLCFISVTLPRGMRGTEKQLGLPRSYCYLFSHVLIWSKYF